MVNSLAVVEHNLKVASYSFDLVITATAIARSSIAPFARFHNHSFPFVYSKNLYRLKVMVYFTVYLSMKVFTEFLLNLNQLFL